jgi:hypothetical protein
MSVVYVMHGVVDFPSPDRFVDRNLLDAGRFERYLENLPTRFVSLEGALDGEGDGLTIDDGIAASSRAALIARSHGHDVTVFVNGFNAEDRSPYWFSLLNLALDRTSRPSIVLSGTEFFLGDTAGKTRFRKAAKVMICGLHTEIERLEYAQRLAKSLGVDDLVLPDSLQPLSTTHLEELINIGVRLQNHGWTHCHPGSMAPRELWRDIEQGQAWLRDRLGVNAPLYAVPFGEAAPPDDSPRDLFRTWLMANSRFFPGRIGKRIFNRVTLRVQGLES